MLNNDFRRKRTSDSLGWGFAKSVIIVFKFVVMIEKVMLVCPKTKKEKRVIVIEIEKEHQIFSLDGIS